VDSSVAAADERENDAALEFRAFWSGHRSAHSGNAARRWIEKYRLCRRVREHGELPVFPQLRCSVEFRLLNTDDVMQATDAKHDST